MEIGKQSPKSGEGWENRWGKNFMELMILAWKHEYKFKESSGNLNFSKIGTSDMVCLEMDFLKCRNGIPILKSRRVTFRAQLSDITGTYVVSGFSCEILRDGWGKLQELETQIYEDFQERLNEVNRILENSFLGMDAQEYLGVDFQFSGLGVEDFGHKLKVKNLLNLI